MWEGCGSTLQRRALCLLSGSYFSMLLYLQVDAIISSLDWLLFEGKHMMDAIHQCNAQMRIFLALKQHDKLRTVFTKLPSDCLAQAMKMTDIDQSNVIKEYICFKTYLVSMVLSLHCWHSQCVIFPRFTFFKGTNIMPHKYSLSDRCS